MEGYEDGPEIQVFVLDHTGKKWPLTMRMRQDVRILRYKVMRLSFIPQVQAAWLIHGGKEAILRHTAIDKWTGNNKTFTLEDGDTIDECLQPGQGLLNGAIIEPVLDDAEYGMSALKVDVKGAVMSLFR